MVRNYHLYRKDKRKYLAQKKFLKQQEKARRQKDRKNNTDNPFYQLLFSNEITKKVAVDKDGNIVYTASIANSFTHVINSLASFLVAYLLVYLVYQLVVLITASFYDIDAILYYYELVFNAHSELWDPLNIIIITISGPINSLFLGFLFFNYFYKKNRKENIRKKVELENHHYYTFSEEDNLENEAILSAINSLNANPKTLKA